MLGIILATHGEFSNGLKDAAEVVVGQTQNIETVQLHAGDDVHGLGNQIAESLQKVDRKKGILILTDLVSASPYNQALLTINHLDPEQQEDISIVTGVNFPMLLEAINAQFLGWTVQEALPKVVAQGVAGITTWQMSDNFVEEEDLF